LLGYLKSFKGNKFSLMVRIEAQRIKFAELPALSFVPESLDPPKGC
jgi:hypothetical protein